MTIEVLELRKKGIGGTDIAAICGMSKFRTRYDVWLEKTNRSEGTPPNEFTISGNRLEQIVVDYFCEATGLTCVDGEFMRSEAEDFIIGNPDRIIIEGDEPTAILECKTTQMPVDPELLPDAWYCQVQWYMGITGIKKAYIAWLVKGVFFGYKELEFDAPYFNDCVEIAKDFWQSYVLADVEPEPVTVSDILKRWPYSSNASVEASDNVLQIVTDLRRVKEQCKALECEKEALENSLKLTLRDKEAITYADQILCTWKTSKPSRRLDVDALKKDHPELYEAYLVEGEPSRRFLLK